MIKSNASPWWRKYYHLRHHQYSGQVNDVEERLIGYVPGNASSLFLFLNQLTHPPTHSTYKIPGWASLGGPPSACW